MGITTISRRSDFLSRPSITTTVVEEPEPVISQPRFSVFGKKARFSVKTEEIIPIRKPKFSTINELATEEAAKEEIIPIRKPKFELHLSNKSVANNKIEENEKEEIIDSATKKKQRKVKFDPIFLEQVCLFQECNYPTDLASAHNKTSSFRLSCPNWPSSIDITDQTYILVCDKKQFEITSNYKYLKGKVMVRNVALDKSVSVRYTCDSWSTVQDVDCFFFGPNPKNIQFDIYEFQIELEWGHQVLSGGELRAKIEFAIRMTANDQDYNGSNHLVKLLCDPLNNPWADEGNSDDEQAWLEEEKHSSFTNALKGYKHAKPFHLNKRQPWLGTRYDFGQSLQLAKRAPYESWATAVKADPTLITDYFLAKPITIKPSTPITTTVVKSSPPKEEKDKGKSLLVSFKGLYNSPPPPPPPPLPVTAITRVNSMLPYVSSAPPSPQLSPPLERPTLHQYKSSTAVTTLANTPLDINSSYYLDLVNKYCFYNPSLATTAVTPHLG